MKKIALVLVAAMVLVFTGCEKKETISMPFDVADVNNIEMYRNVVPNSAEKQVITKTDDIEDIYFLFSGLEVSDKKTEPVAGGTVTSFRFNLSNDTSYEIIYCAEAVKSGRLKLPEEKLDYFTAADIESYWDNYQYEIVPVSENELPGQEETQEWDKIPMVMVDGKLYYDTGKESTISGRCGVMDGEITSSVDGSEIPTKDNQSNFGTGFEYQYGADNTIEIFMNEKWIVFEQREGAGRNKVETMYVEMKNIYKKYGDFLASDNVSFGVEKGKLVALLGPSGSGKTTLLRMIAGLENPNEGDIFIDGKRVNDIPASKRGIGFVFQSYALFRYMTVYENVAFAQRIVETPVSEIRRNVPAILATVGLAGKYKAKTKQLSGGEQQRVALARALVNNPSILLADEPTGNLDPNNSWEIMKLLEEINESGTTVVVVTHNREIVNAMQKRVITMKKGVIISDEEKGGYIDED